jgi:hypothetical protein
MDEVPCIELTRSGKLLTVTLGRVDLNPMPESETLDLPSVAKFIVPDWGDKVNSGKGLSYLPAKLHRLAGRYDNPMPKSTISPSQRL